GLNLGLGGSWLLPPSGVYLFGDGKLSGLIGIDGVDLGALFDNNDAIPASYMPPPNNDPYQHSQEAILGAARLEAGLGWTGHIWNKRLRLAAGCQTDWLSLHAATVQNDFNITTHLGNNVYLRSHGVFLRCEVGF